MIGLSQPPSEDGEAMESTGKYTLGVALSVVSAIGMALIATSTRKLKEIHFAVIQCLYAASSTLICGALVFAQNYPRRRIPFVFDSQRDYWLLIVAAVFNFTGQNLMTISNQSANPALIGLLSYCGILYNFGTDTFILKKSFTSL